MKVSLNLPDKVWGRLTGLAEKRGVTVAHLIGDAIETLLPPPLSQLEILNQEISAAHAQGWRSPRRGKK